MSISTPARGVLPAGPPLGRMATVDAAGKPHAVPVGYRYDQSDTITIGGHRLDRSKKWRDLHDNPHVAYVVDDLVSVDPWRPQGVEIRGRAALHGAHENRSAPGSGRPGSRSGLTASSPGASTPSPAVPPTAEPESASPP